MNGHDKARNVEFEVLESLKERVVLPSADDGVVAVWRPRRSCVKQRNAVVVVVDACVDKGEGGRCRFRGSFCDGFRG